MASRTDPTEVEQHVSEWPEWYQQSALLRPWWKQSQELGTQTVIPRARYDLGDHEKWFQGNHPLLLRFIREQVLNGQRDLPRKRDRLRNIAMVIESCVVSTLAGSFANIRLLSGQRTEHVPYRLTDGGTVCTHTYWPKEFTPQTPLIFLIPSLTSQHRHLSLLIQHILNQLKWIAVVYNRRGNCCALTSPMFHVCGYDPDLDHVLTQLKQQFAHNVWFGLGISMGGHILSRYLGKYAEKSSDMFIACGTICSPISHKDIYVDTPLAEAALLKCMRDTWLEPCKTMMFEQANRVGVERYVKLMKATTAVDFMFANGEMFTSSREELLREYDSANFVQRIRVPTLCLTSDDDEIIRYATSTQSALVHSRMIGWLHTVRGKHCLYRAAVGQTLTQLSWAEQLQLDYFQFTWKEFQTTVSSTVI